MSIETKTIKIVQINEKVNKSSSPNRIRLCLQKKGISARILTAYSEVNSEDVIEVKKSFLYKVLRKITTIINNIEYKLNYQKDANMPFSYYNVGINIAKEEAVKDADIILLHWICASFVSVHGVKRLMALEKPIIWVCHDNWPFTGGCHVRMGCERFQKECGMCPQLHSKRKMDWSYRLLKAKKKIIQSGNVVIVSPSTWMDKNVAQSSLFAQCKHYVIPNSIDLNNFAPADKQEIREKNNICKESIVILFGAVKATSTPYKGYSYLIEALDMLEEKLGETLDITVVVFGASSGQERKGKKIKINYLGYLGEKEMAEAYNLADVYIVPSLEDSFNNTVAESLACETPVVAFATGGITDIIDHKENGYLAKYRETEDLANGVIWVLKNNDNNRLGKAGRKKIENSFSQSVVAEKWLQLFEKEVSHK